MCVNVSRLTRAAAHGNPNRSCVKWSTSVHSRFFMVRVHMRSFAFKKAKEEVELENLRLWFANHTCL